MTQNKPEQLELDLDPLCRMQGCMYQQLFISVRKLQQTIGELERKLNDYNKS